MLRVSTLRVSTLVVLWHQGLWSNPKQNIRDHTILKTYNKFVGPDVVTDASNRWGLYRESAGYIPSEKHRPSLLPHKTW